MSLIEKANAVIGNLPQDKKLGVAVSGGSDSMCLLSFLIHSSSVKKENIIVLNVDHGIRGENSASDTAFVKKFCEDNGIAFKGVSFDIPSLASKSGRSTETEARIQRHGFFRETVISGEADYILLAHNAHDRTESILMHIFRGCGLGGLVGMRETDGYILRPLLNCNKDEILGYLSETGVSYVTDETNSDSMYSRNYLRNEIIPLIKKKWPGLDDAVKRLSVLASALEDGDDAPSVTVEGITGEKVKRAFIAAGFDHDYTKAHIDAVLSLAGAQTGSGIDLPGGFTAVKSYGEIVIMKKKPRFDEEIPFKTGKISICGRTVSISETAPAALKTKTVIDADKVPPGAVFRTRRDGDRFRCVKGKNRLLSDYLSDKKIPLYERDGLILLASGSDVLLIVDMAVGENVKIEKTTKKAVLIEY